MSSESGVHPFDLGAVVDLRKIRSRELVESLSDRAKHLPDDEMALINEVFVVGKSLSELAKSRGESASHIGRRVKKITSRVFDPRYRFVTEHKSAWRTTRRRVASACIIEGLSIREASLKLKMSRHNVRKHREAIDAMYESTPTRDLPK